MQKIKIASLKDRIKSEKPKRILSLDGGGTKGIVTIAMLEKLEHQLRMRLPQKEKDGFRLNQFFDYIGGTSTGSIIAVLLSLGFSMQAIKQLYLDLSKQIFSWRSKRGLTKLIQSVPMYGSHKLEQYLQKMLDKRPLGDPEIYNLLAIFTKNTLSNNIWTLNNNPESKFYNKSPEGEDWYPNKDQLLRDLVRASTAAPVYFLPKKLNTNQKDSIPTSSAYFIDGGVSMENNPAFRLFLMATVPDYHLKWKKGADDLLITSFGTGIFTQVYKSGLMDIAKSLPGMYINNASQTTDMIMRALSSHQAKSNIDKELKDIQPHHLGIQPVLSYRRYSLNFRDLGIKKVDGICEKAIWSKMDEPGTMKELYELAGRYFDFTLEKQIPSSFLGHYYDWENRLIDGKQVKK